MSGRWWINMELNGVVFVSEGYSYAPPRDYEFLGASWERRSDALRALREHLLGKLRPLQEQLTQVESALDEAIAEEP